MERPKSPRSTLARNVAYWTGRGRSNPSSVRTRKISLRGASGGRSSGTGSPLSRMTTKTTVETSHSAISARSNRWARKPRVPRMGKRPGPLAAPAAVRSGAAELEVEAADLELLVGVRRPLHVLLQTVVLVGLHHRDPREVLEEDLRHLPVGLPAELLVHREARRLPQLVEARVAPVVLRPAGTQQAPHHAVGIAEGGGRIRPPEPLEGPVAVLLRADGVLDHFHLGVDADLPPHALDRLGHGLVVGGVADRGLDDDLFVLVARFPEPLARLARVVGERRQRRVVVVVALGDGAAGHDAASPPQLFDDELAVHGQREGLLHQRVVEGPALAVHRQDIEPRLARAYHLGGAGAGH